MATISSWTEYSLRALFPDKEPTDHEIRGKQYFHVTGKLFLLLFSLIHS